jgi:rRNA-processing protein FCF1
VQLRAGVTCEEAIEALDHLAQTELIDITSSLPSFGERGYETAILKAINRYDRWTKRATQKLAELFWDRSVHRRPREGRYALILSSAGEVFRTQQLLMAEVSELQLYLIYDLTEQLREQADQYRHHLGRTLVLDTNTLLHYSRLDTVPWSTLYKKNAVVMLPHVVIDEIETKAYNSANLTGKRARAVYRILEQKQDEMDACGYAELRDGTKLEILADDPGHVRLDNNDNEAVARAAYLQQALRPGQVTVITRDIGMRARARTWGLKAEPLPEKYLIPSDGFSAAKLDEDLALLPSANPGQ